MTAASTNLVVAPTTKNVQVVVQTLTGNELRLDMEAKTPVSSLKVSVSEAWGLEPSCVSLTIGVIEPSGETLLADLLQHGTDGLQMQLIKFDPLPRLGHFDVEGQSKQSQLSIAVENAQGDGQRSTLRKISEQPGSNNVFLAHEIREPCFAEFLVAQTRDEMAFGVASGIERVAGASANDLELASWSYAKVGRNSQPLWYLFFGGQKPQRLDSTAGFRAGDLVAVFVDPDAREVRFYKNGEFVMSNLPSYPLPDALVQIFVQVDMTDDEVQIVRFGPGSPY